MEGLILQSRQAIEQKLSHCKRLQPIQKKFKKKVIGWFGFFSVEGGKVLSSLIFHPDPCTLGRKGKAFKPNHFITSSIDAQYFLNTCSMVYG